MNRELVTGLAQLSAEKGLPKEVVGDIIARALKRAYGAEENIDVKVDITTGAFKVYLLKTVTEKVEDPKLQIQLDAAKRIKPDVQLGDIVPLEESDNIHRSAPCAPSAGDERVDLEDPGAPAAHGAAAASAGAAARCAGTTGAVEPDLNCKDGRFGPPAWCGGGRAGACRDSGQGFGRADSG